MSATNPYAPPRAHVDDVAPAESAAEAIRREHIQHETSVRAIGSLYYFGAVLMLLVGIVLVAGFSVQPQTTPELRGLATITGFIYLVLGVVSIVVGRGLRRLQPWARIASIVLSLIGLLGFPIGTLINGYFLYLLFAEKGRRVFASDYAAIVAATPHVKYRTSVVTWIVLGLLLLVIVGGIVLGIMSGGG